MKNYLFYFFCDKFSFWNILYNLNYKAGVEHVKKPDPEKNSKKGKI
jgi:hypothetical protein